MRKLTIHRKKNLLACNAVKFIVKLDGQPVGKLANGGSLELTISSGAHILEFLNSIPMGNNNPTPVTVPAGSGDCTARLAIDNRNMGLVRTNWAVSLECAPGNPMEERRNAVKLLLHCLLLDVGREGDLSIAAKLKEFRAAGLDLHVCYDVGPTCITVSPDERRGGYVVGEPYELNYRELTSLSDGKVVEALTMDERLYLAKEIEGMRFDGLRILRDGARLDVSLG